jgi:hypothetical protein
MLCPSCQQSIPSESQFCPLCGYSFSEKQETSETGECSSCGVSYNLPAPLFCSSCGYALSEPSTYPYLVYSPDPNLENQPDGMAENLDADKREQGEDASFEKNGYHKAATILGVLIVVGIIFIGAASLLQKNRTTPPNPTPNMETIYTAAWETAIAGENISAVFFTSTPNTQQPPEVTSPPEPTSTTSSTAPVIEKIEFPHTIVCDGRRYDALIYFHDTDGNAYRISYELVYSKKGAHFTSEPVQLAFSSQDQAQETVLSDYVEWHTAGDEVIIKVIIEDTTGQSNAKEYEFRCSS